MYGDTPKNGGIPLAHRADFRLGDATVRPSLCTVAGPQGSVTVEPRVMEVLVTLVDAGGAVLSRDDLMQACWRGAIVSEDAINRTIREIRRAARETGSGFGIETISRVGYRLTGAAAADVGPAGNGTSVGAAPASEPVPPPPQAPRPATRRWLLGAGLATAAAAVALMLYGRDRRVPAPDPQILRLINEARLKLRWEHVSPPGTDIEAVEGIKELKEALELDSGNALTWGWMALACAHAAENDVTGAVDKCLEAVGKARNLGGDSNAEVAAALIRRGDDTWAQTEDKLRDVLKASADNIPAHIALAQLLQSVGRTRESMQENAIIRKLDERAAEGWPAQDFRWAIQLWIVGERDQASQAALRVTRDHDLLHPAAWRNALFVHAMTADYRKAETLLERARREAKATPAFDRQWRLALEALEFRYEAARARAFAGLGLPEPREMGFVHRNTILWELGQTDTAWSEFSWYFHMMVDPHQIVPVAPGRTADHNPRWRLFQWVFTPGMRNLHCHPRFMDWAEKHGLAAYWRERRGPDQQHICQT